MGVNLPPEKLHVAHLNAADTFASIGHFSQARYHSQCALETAPDSVTSERRAQLLRSSARVLTSGFDAGEWTDHAALRDALRLLEQAWRLVDDDSVWSHAIDIQVATTHGRLGNRAVQQRDLERALKRARAQEERRGEMWALLNLGILHAELGRPAEACRLLTQAREIGEALDDHPTTFECSFQLWQAAEGIEGWEIAREHAWRKCVRLYPEMTPGTDMVRGFESVLHGEGR